MSTENEGRCCDAVLRVIEQRNGATRRIASIDTAATPGVDLRCEIGGQKFALEHTTLDPYPDRRADDQRFLDVMAPLIKRLAAENLPADRHYQLFTDTGAFRSFKKRDLAAIQAQIGDWVVANSRLQPPGRGRAAVVWGYPPEIPVRAMLQCCEARGMMSGKVHVGRFAPENLEDLRLERVRAAIQKKCPKLEAERRAGAVAVLVLENADIAISSHVLIAKCVSTELERAGCNVDEIYLVETCSPTEWLVHTLKLEGSQWPTATENPPLLQLSPLDLKDPYAAI